MTHIPNYHVFLHITFLVLGIVASTISWLAHLFLSLKSIQTAFQCNSSVVFCILCLKVYLFRKNAKDPNHFIS